MITPARPTEASTSRRGSRTQTPGSPSGPSAETVSPVAHVQVVAAGGCAHWPVLKHGPRSLTCLQVVGLQPPLRNESEPCEICSKGRDERAQQACWDPKDGELCLGKAKPGETLVEACRVSDVQIVLLT